LKHQKAFLYQVLIRTPAFKAFFQTQGYKGTPQDLSPDELAQVLRDFFFEEAGELEAQRIGLDLLDHRPVKVIPHSKGEIREGVFDISTHLKEGKILTLEIDLTSSQNELIGHIKREIERYSDKVKREKIKKTRGEGIIKDHEFDKIFKAYDLIKGGMTHRQAMEEIFTGTKGKKDLDIQDKKQKIKRWYEKIAKYIPSS
jgi:hypothetical protein